MMKEKKFNNINPDAKNLRLRFIELLFGDLLFEALPRDARNTFNFNKMPESDIGQIRFVIKLLKNVFKTQSTNDLCPDVFPAMESLSFDYPFNYLLRIFGGKNLSDLLEHAEQIDNCIAQSFEENQVIKFHHYLESKFGYKNIDGKFDSTTNDFCILSLLSFIAHLDAYIHYSEPYQLVRPISFGWLFMYKPDPKKWKYDSSQDDIILINKNQSPYTKPSRSFIELLQVIAYWNTHKQMPTRIPGINNKIDWLADDPNGELENKIKRLKEGKWIRWHDISWLFGIKDDIKAQEDWEKSIKTFIKTKDINKIGLEGQYPNFEAMLWFVYAFFQLIYERTKERTKEKGYDVTYTKYYKLWQSFAGYYELKLDNQIKEKRIEWPEFIKIQAIPIKNMACSK